MMTLRTVKDIVAAANAAKDLQAAAANHFLLYRKHANGLNDIWIPREQFTVVAVGVEGTAEIPLLKFALIWTERGSWQVSDYRSPDSDLYVEGFGADNSTGHHTESRERQQEMYLTIGTGCLLESNDSKVDTLKRLKAEHDFKKRSESVSHRSKA